MADAHLQLPLFHFLPPIPRSEALDRAKVAAARAVALDDELGEAHAALGVARWYDWDWDGAERSLRRALMLNPAAASVRQRYGLLLTFLGRFDEAARELRRATTLDPLSLYVAVDRGVVELRAGRLELAVAHFQKVLDLRPGFAPAQHYLAEAYAYDGRVEASLSLHMQRGLVDAATGEWMRTLIRSGQLHEYFAEWAARAERSNASPAIVACAWARAGEIERGWEWLDRAVAERDPALTDGVRVHPGFNPYRGTPRFAALLRQMRVEERFGAAPSSW